MLCDVYTYESIVLATWLSRKGSTFLYTFLLNHAVLIAVLCYTVDDREL